MTENLRQRDGDQPLPTEGDENVQDALIAHILASPRLGAGANNLAAKIMERRALGIQRYGRPLQTFNGRDPHQDLLDELLDGATYAMQIRMEAAATQARISAALHLHAASADNGLCISCKVVSPCETRCALTGQPGLRGELTVKKTEPVEEVAVHPDSLDDFKSRFRIREAERRLGGPMIPGDLFGFPVVCDESIPPGVVRLRPFGFDNHPSHGTKESS
jgi:hypothetical protein